MLDVLRGFALFGVLYVNLHDFGAYRVSGPTHDVVKSLMMVFFESKFFGLFSLLFGMGFALQLMRAESRKASFFRVYWRRLLVLFVIGWIHCALYEGDILRLYAFLALGLFLFGKWPLKRLVGLAVAILVLDLAIYWTFESGIVHWDAVDAETVEIAPAVSVSPATDETAARTLAHRSGSFSDVVVFNLTSSKTLRLLRGYGPGVFALFLLGMAAIRAGLVHDRTRHAARIRRIMWWSLLIGLPCAAGGEVLYLYITDESSVQFQTAQLLLYNIGFLVLMIFYASAVTVLLERPGWHRYLRPLAAVGRMALTVYIFQSILYTTLYYGYAIGQYGKLGPAHMFPIAVVVFVLEVVACNLWMTRFRFGPLEWVWRSLTYWKRQPFRIAAP